MKSKIPLAVAVLSALFALSGLRVPSDQRDATAFGALPVLHGGRVKPLDSVARSTILVVRGKQSVEMTGRRLSPTGWLLTTSANPVLADEIDAFRIDDPDVLSLIGKRSESGRYHSFASIAPSFQALDAQYARAESVDPPLRTRFERAVVNLYERLELYHRMKNSIRLEGSGMHREELTQYRATLEAAGPLLAAHGAGGPDGSAEAMQRAMQAFARYRGLAEVSLYRPIPPAAGEKPEQWRNPGEALMDALDGKPVSPMVDHYWNAMDAFRSGDEEGFRRETAAAHALAQRLAPGPAANARHEALFNRLDLFTKGMALYVFGFLAAALFWLKGGETTRRAAFSFVGVAFAVHTVGMIARMVLAGRPPVTNLYSSAVFVGWGAVLIGLTLEYWHENGIGSAASAIVGFATLVIAHHLAMSGDTMEMMQAVLDSNFWLATHVVTITIGYSSVFLAGALAHVYLIGGALGKLTEKTRKSLVQMVYGVICFALLFSFVGTVLGGIWADQSWGRFWGWDPKENGALLIVLWLAVVLHARFAGLIRERGLMVSAVFANVVTAMAWFGVNMLGVGLHSYGFMDKAAFWLIVFSASQFLVMGLGLLGNGWISHPESRAA
ncbi:MAG: hypothetical protein AUJ52_10860 [Elusimicrobia bacterium CG1_02_63_36]|nr:MAG: hypothetical protein AUJ52_10860 [Elusimicrobia bacterium CG1_02_63_36]PIP83393.1 MAG: cytochrome C assembly protein [Elusimicrobia bacterium CG22_combo_CG10-13_8_21_14_all_63_91]PJA11645.1 MAG: cytochrome C assembly protein [Elusimicrobia bacterium CG_4_10_14_0_2_um_filter_63_34]PJB23058.1 MAG: cytochrome C assembly protein [Elusimicrobia bacterium CG_4_9_14_3_um_filter_62_55]